MEQVIGATIDGYKITERLGQGGMGAVFLGAKDCGPPVAVKLLLLQDRDEQVSAVSRLIDEIKAAPAIKHPNVVPIISTGCHDEYGLFVIYDFISGGSLDSRLQKLGRLKEEEVLNTLVPSVLQGLAALHTKGVFHRDIKPANILYDGQGSYLIGDLGLAVFDGRKAKTKTGTFVGTPGYMPPERINSANKGGKPQGDIYSATILFIEALTGKKPFKSTLPVEIIKETVSRQFKAAELVKLGVPKALAHCFARALSQKPEERPENCESYLKEIKAAQGGEEKTKTLVASSVHLRESLSTFDQPSKKAKKPAMSPGRILFFLLFMLAAVSLLGWRSFRRKTPVPRRRASSRSMKALVRKWSNDVAKVSNRKGKKLLPINKARRLRDIHRAFHRGFDFTNQNIARALRLENQILRAIYFCDWGNDSQPMDEILLQSETFLNDMPPNSRFNPNWVLSWHLHLLVRAAFCHRARITSSARAILKVLSINPLPLDLDDRAKAFVEKEHRKFELPQPRYVHKSKRMKTLNGLGLGYKKYYVLTGNLSQKLSLKSISHFMDKTVDEQNEQKRIRNRYARRIVAGFWHTYLVRTHGKLCNPLFWQHQKYVTWLLKARYSDASELLADKDYPWGPGLSSPLVIRSLFCHWRNLIRHTAKTDELDDWNTLYELFVEARNILRNLEGPALSTYRQGLNDTVLPHLPRTNIFHHLIKARLIIEDPVARNNEQSKERFKVAEPHSRTAIELAMAAIEQSRTLSQWTESHWMTVRRVVNMRFAVLDTIGDFTQMEKESDELRQLVANNKEKAGPRAAFQLRDVGLLATLMKARFFEQHKKPLPNTVIDKLNHAKKNIHQYDTGRRHSAVLLLKRLGLN